MSQVSHTGNFSWFSTQWQDRTKPNKWVNFKKKTEVKVPCDYITFYHQFVKKKKTIKSHMEKAYSGSMCRKSSVVGSQLPNKFG